LEIDPHGAECGERARPVVARVDVLGADLKRFAGALVHGYLPGLLMAGPLGRLRWFIDEPGPYPGPMTDRQFVSAHAAGTALSEWRDRAAAARDEIRSRIEAIEPQLADTDARRKQLGDAPEAGAPREDPAIAAERDRLDKSHAELDAALKQVKLLSLRADQL